MCGVIMGRISVHVYIENRLYIIRIYIENRLYIIRIYIENRLYIIRIYIENRLYIRPVRSIQFLILHIKYNTYLYFSIICVNNVYKKIVTFGHEAFKV